ncbi:TipAS antibiotic-recognition domain-containing protein [Streptomyces sp. NPDC014846]|uniref:TipAS antibiotic-recognition domain-containing protein n=1 Tax=Streptomyces sp. NPDC014846 TaxID=3364922 RepID=UPI0036FA9091
MWTGSGSTRTGTSCTGRSRRSWTAAPCRDEQIQELVRRHFDIVSRFYTPSREAYVGMSLFYAEDEAMRAFHDSYHPGMVEFLGAAIRVFAEQGSGFAPSAGAEASA